MKQVPGVSLATLQTHFIKLLTTLSEGPITFPTSGKHTELDSNPHLRIDIEGIDPKILSIEDNIPYRGKINGKTLSSVFSKIKLINPPKTMSGAQLAALLLLSQTTEYQGKRCCIVVCFPKSSITNMKKKKKKKMKMKMKTHKKHNQQSKQQKEKIALGAYEALFEEKLDDLTFSADDARLSLSNQLNTPKNTAENSVSYGY